MLTHGHAHASYSRAPVHSLQFSVQCLGTQAAFDKVQNRVRHFGGVFNVTVVNEAVALAHMLFLVCDHASLHPVQACMALLASGGDECLFTFFAYSCKVRATTATAAADLNDVQNSDQILPSRVISDSVQTHRCRLWSRVRVTAAVGSNCMDVRIFGT